MYCSEGLSRILVNHDSAGPLRDLFVSTRSSEQTRQMATVPCPSRYRLDTTRKCQPGLTALAR